MIASLGRAAAAALLLSTASAAWASAAMDEAQAQINKGQYEQALRTLDSHLNKVPQDAEARFARGLVLVKLGRTSDAQKAFADLTRDYPQLPEPYNNLAVLYAQQGDYEKARDALEAALATHPSYATAHENLGDIYAALASAAYNRALMLDQNNGTVRQKLRLMDQLDTLPQETANLPPPIDPPVRAAQPAAPATSAPAAPVAAAPAVNDSAQNDAVVTAVFNWAQAWSAQDVDGYLDAYAPDFEPGGGMSRSAWADLRRQRVAAPSSISVKVIDPEVISTGPQTARVNFTQEYSSATYSDRVAKVLEMRQSGGKWLITREYSR